MFATKHVSRALAATTHTATVRIGQTDYGSHFQPIAARCGSVIAHEALLRPAREGVLESAIRIADVFPAGLPHGEFVMRDQLIRLLHCLNFSRSGHSGKLFLNSHSKAFVDCARNGDLSAELCHELGFEPGRVVLEILEDDCAPVAELLEARLAFGRLGFMVAVDDFGSGASDHHRVTALAPDYVKLDRSYVARAQADVQFMEQSSRYTRALRDAGTTVIAEGIETPFDVDSAAELGAGLMQGYLIDRRVAMRQHNYAALI